MTAGLAPECHSHVPGHRLRCQHQKPRTTGSSGLKNGRNIFAHWSSLLITKPSAPHNTFQLFSLG